MDAFNDFEFILDTFSMLNNTHREFLKKYFIAQAASKLMQKRYEFSELLVFVIALLFVFVLFFIFCFANKTFL